MRFLLDVNIWLQIVRNRDHSPEVQSFLSVVPASQLCFTDFGLHALAIVMKRHKVLSDFPAFLASSGIGATIELIHLTTGELVRVVDACQTYNLDFDDAYHYVAAEIHNLKLVSFDTDFDRTPNGRLTPAAAAKDFKDEQQKQQGS